MSWLDNFDSEALGTPPSNWPEYPGKPFLIRQIDNVHYHSSPHSMWLKSQPSVHGMCGATQPFTTERIRLWVYFEDTAKDFRIITCKNTVGYVAGNWMAYLYASTDGKIYYYDTGANPVGDYTTGWHYFDIVHDWGTDTFDAWYDGVQIVTSGSFFSNQTGDDGAGINIFMPLGADNEVWVDDVEVGAGPVTGFVNSIVAEHDATWPMVLGGRPYLHTDNVLYILYQKKKSEAGFDGKTSFKTSSDLGLTWSSETDLLDSGSGAPAMLSCEMFRSSLGAPHKRIFMIWGEIYNITPPNLKIELFCKYNDDNLAGGLVGASWSTPVKLVPPVYDYNQIAGQMIQLPSDDPYYPNRLMIPNYWSSTDGSYFHAGVQVSDDNGVTWTNKGDIDIAASSRGALEPSIIRYPNGQIDMYLRAKGPGYHYKSTSYDGGDTWSIPVITTFQCSATIPCMCNVLLLESGGQLFAWNNSPTARYPLDIVTSMDKFNTYSAPLTLNDGAASIYPLLSQDGDDILIFWSLQGSYDVMQSKGKVSDLPAAPSTAMIIKNAIIKNSVVRAV